MAAAIRAAVIHGVSLGVHPGLPDLQGFGRRALAITPDEAYNCIVYQVGALQAFATVQGQTLHHVKVHGALYNMASKNRELALAICNAVRDVDPNLLLYGLAASEWVYAAEILNVPLVQEVFADRTYQDDGTLTPRTHPDAMIVKVDQAIGQVSSMVRKGIVRSLNGVDVNVKAETLCIHGDQPGAAEFAKCIRATLESDGILVRAPVRNIR